MQFEQWLAAQRVCEQAQLLRDEAQRVREAALHLRAELTERRVAAAHQAAAAQLDGRG